MGKPVLVSSLGMDKNLVIYDCVYYCVVLETGPITSMVCVLTVQHLWAIMVSFSLNQPSLNNLLVIFLHNMQYWDSWSWGQTWLTHLPMTIINNKPNVQTYNKLKIVKVFDGFSDLLQSCSVIFFFTQLFVHHILWNKINRKLFI